MEWTDFLSPEELAMLQNMTGSDPSLANIGKGSFYDNANLSMYLPVPDKLEDPLWRTLIVITYIVVISLGILFNSVVVFIMARNRNMWNVTNIFIGNLAVSDIFICGFNLPFQLHYQITDNWIFGDTLCRIIQTSFGIPLYVSTFTMMFIAIDRYWLIIYPFKPRMSLKIAICMMSFSVIVSMLMSVPVAIYSATHQVKVSNVFYKSYCYERWPLRHGRKAYSAFMFAAQFCLPLILTSIMYLQIFLRLKGRTMRRSDSQRKHRTNKILIGIVVVFCICWLPWNLFSIIMEIWPGVNHLGSFTKFTDLLLKIFAMSSACVNPFLYGWFNENFRKEMASLVVRIHRERKSTTVDDVNENDMATKPLASHRNTSTSVLAVTIDKTGTRKASNGTGNHWAEENGDTTAEMCTLAAPPSPAQPSSQSIHSKSNLLTP